MRLFLFLQAMNELIFATNNLHKLEEIREILYPEFSIRGLEESGIREEIPEDHETLMENAFQKAKYIFDKTGCDCFADDTGLEVKALGGAPGVYSARFSRTGFPVYPEMEVTAGNIRKLLELLQGASDRSAQFRTAICLIVGGTSHYFEGIVKGTILENPTGRMGFGYDPVFQPEGYKLSFAEMSLDRKNQISHRAKAVESLVAFLKSASFEARE